MSRMSLDNVTSGKMDEPYKVVVFGKMGVGKSQFGASAPAPIVMDVENSTSEIDVARFPRPESLADVREGLGFLLNEKHEYKTVVIDTADAVEQLIWDQVIQAARKDAKYANITTLEEVGGGYGKGAAAALMVWRLVLADLDALFEKRRMNVIVLGHAAVKKFKSPEVAVEPFDRYEIKLLPTARDLVSEWPKAIMFADYEVLSTDKDGKIYGVSTGNRLLRTTHSAAWDAKNRYGLPDTIPLNWAEFDKAAKAGRATQKSTLADEIRALIPKLPQAMQKDVEGVIAKAGGDAEKLQKALQFYKSKIAA